MVGRLTIDFQRERERGKVGRKKRRNVETEKRHSVLVRVRSRLDLSGVGSASWGIIIDKETPFILDNLPYQTWNLQFRLHDASNTKPFYLVCMPHQTLNLCVKSACRIKH